MKLRKAVTLMALLAISSFPAFSQDQTPPLNEPGNKPKQFADLPDKMPLKVSALETLLDLPVGTRVNATIADNLPLIGVIVSKSNPSDFSVKSVVVKSTNRQAATFTFTRRQDANGTFSFIGRMVNRNAGDALEIVKEGNDYVIRKKELSRIMSE